MNLARIANVSDYEKLFEVSYSTAKRYLAGDKKYYQSTRITLRQLMKHWGLELEDMRVLSSLKLA